VPQSGQSTSGMVPLPAGSFQSTLADDLATGALRRMARLRACRATAEGGDPAIRVRVVRFLRRPGRLAEAVAPAAASAPVEMPREARALLALVQQGGAASAAEQLASVERIGELLVDGDRQRIHADDLRPRADARMSTWRLIGHLRGGRRSRRPTRPQPRPPVLSARREQSCCDRRLSVERRKTFPVFRRT
jgi:hypothetical protein